MAVQDPLWLQALTYSGAEDRQLLRALLTATGVKRSSTSTGELAVTQTSTASMNLNVATGYAFITAPTPPTQGSYLFYNDATVTVTVTASDATLPRIDLVVARVYDSAVSGTVDQGALEVVPGTPASSPVAPATPAGALALAQVLVGAGVTSISNSNITDVRTYWTIANYWQAPSTAAPALRLQGRSGQTGDIFDVESSSAQKFLRVAANGDVYIESSADLVVPAMRAYSSIDQGSTTSTTSGPVQVSGTPTGTFVAPSSGMVKMSLTAFVQSSGGGAYSNAFIEVRTGSTVGSGTLVANNVATVTNANTEWIKMTGASLVDGLTAGSTYNYRVVVSRTIGTGTAYASTSRVMIEYMV